MRLISIVAAATAFAVSATAVAQVEVRDHRKKKGKDDKVVVPVQPAEATVSGFTPTAGPVGTVVTINGNYFTKATKVKVGGTPTKVIAWTQQTVQFAIPGRFGDGVITLHNPGMGAWVTVGTFAVQVPPRIAGFQPGAGPVGTRVELTGEGFMAGDQILFNGKPLATAELAPGRVVVVIPPGATSDYFTVSRPSQNYAATSKKKFQVVLPNIVVGAISPKAGPPGTKVRISGQNFGPDVKVAWGKNITLNPTGVAETWIDVVVPANATASQAFHLWGPRGGGQTEVFALELAPTITLLDPMGGAVGSQVLLGHTNLLAGDRIYFGNIAAKEIRRTADRVQVEVPAGAQTGPIAVWRGGKLAAQTAKSFTVLVAPSLTSFAPASGPAGTQVTLSGANFVGNIRVAYGAQQLKIVSRTDHQIVVVVPGGAGNQPFTVFTPGGSVTSATAFQVIVPARITSINPGKGWVGQRVAIVVDGGSGNDSFWLGPTSLPVVERSGPRYVVTIPPGAATGKLAVESYGHRFESNITFQVIAEPKVASIEPSSGRPGTVVTIRGTGFTGAAAAFIGGKPMTLKSRGPQQIVAIVPNDMPAGAHAIVVNEGGSQLAAGTFTVAIPPTITKVDPARGQPGSQFAIRGSGFTAQTTATLGGKALTIKVRDASGMIVVVPADMPAGRFGLVVNEGGVSVQGPAFEVLAPPAPPPPPPPPPPPAAAKCELTLSAAQAPAGGQVAIKITGCELKGTLKVWYKTEEAKIVSKTDDWLTVTLPAKATGTDYLTIEQVNPGAVSVRVRTKQKVTIGKGAVVVPVKPSGGY